MFYECMLFIFFVAQMEQKALAEATGEGKHLRKLVAPFACFFFFIVPSF
jgi:hypothetical protein